MSIDGNWNLKNKFFKFKWFVSKAYKNCYKFNTRANKLNNANFVLFHMNDFISEILPSKRFLNNFIIDSYLLLLLLFIHFLGW